MNERNGVLAVVEVVADEIPERNVTPTNNHLPAPSF
jgi:hypothetical protein